MRDISISPSNFLLKAYTAFEYNRCQNCSILSRTCVFIYGEDTCKRCSKHRIVCPPQLPYSPKVSVLNMKIGNFYFYPLLQYLSLMADFLKISERKLPRRYDTQVIQTSRDYSKFSDGFQLTPVSISCSSCLFLDTNVFN